MYKRGNSLKRMDSIGKLGKKGEGSSAGSHRLWKEEEGWAGSVGRNPQGRGTRSIRKRECSTRKFSLI